MIIDGLRHQVAADVAELSARVVWEDVDREPQTVYFRVPARFADLLWAGVEPFLCAAVVPAMAAGESRVHSELPACPVLLDSMETAIFWLRKWYPARYSSPAPVLSLPHRRESVASPAKGAGLFLSGGIDSFYSLRRNMRYLPERHPARVRHTITVLGFDIGGKKAQAGSADAATAFNALLRHTQPISAAVGAENIALETNLRHLDDRSGFWGEEFVGAALGAVANALSGGLDRVFVSSGGETIPEKGMRSAMGTHPLVDGCFGNGWMQIHHYAIQEESRLRRVAMVVEDEILLHGIRVCYASPPDRLNCGRCEKCVRTMLQLEALGKLSHCRAFDGALRPELVDAVDISIDSVETMFVELRDVFKRQGRQDFVVAIERLLARYKVHKGWRDQTDWKGTIKRLDKRFLNGLVGRVSTRVR